MLHSAAAAHGTRAAKEWSPRAAPRTGEKPAGRRRAKERDGSAVGASTAFDLSAEELAPFAQRLAARRLKIGGPTVDPLEMERAWKVVAFQAEGVAEQLSARDACMLIRELAAANVLGRGRHEGAKKALLGVLRRSSPVLHGQEDGEASLIKPSRIVSVWCALDRVDAAEDAETAAFFSEQLPRALPAIAAGSTKNTVRDEESQQDAPSAPKASDRDWRRAAALLAASGCSRGELQRLWASLEAAALADAERLRTLPMRGLVYAMRAGAQAAERVEAQPSHELVLRVSSRIIAQARWLDGWAASHTALAAATLGVASGKAYDPLRPALLEHCRLERPGAGAGQKGAGGGATRTVRATDSTDLPGWGGGAAQQGMELAGLTEAERVASALARFDVHDAEVREKIATWLLGPLPPERLARLAESLVGAGLSEANAPKVARHVRARLRSSEVQLSIGVEASAALLRKYGGQE